MTADSLLLTIDSSADFAMEQEVDDICQELAITSNNCGVMLYRARMQLRECLDRNWFKGQR